MPAERSMAIDELKKPLQAYLGLFFGRQHGSKVE
jgi:hypothetical protein